MAPPPTIATRVSSRTAPFPRLSGYRRRLPRQRVTLGQCQDTHRNHDERTDLDVVDQDCHHADGGGVPRYYRSEQPIGGGGESAA